MNYNVTDTSCSKFTAIFELWKACPHKELIKHLCEFMQASHVIPVTANHSLFIVVSDSYCSLGEHNLKVLTINA